MKGTSTATRVAGLLFSVLMSATVIGATVIGLERSSRIGDEPLMLDPVVVSAAAPMAID
jgi:hypothetical protein